MVYAGNAGTSFDARTMDALWTRLEPLITPECPFGETPPIARPASWVRPELVCEGKFAEWTREGRLRAPVFLGLRPDLDPFEAVREGGAKEPPGPARNLPRLPLPGGTADEATLDIAGRTLRFTNLDKVFYPREGYRKRDLVTYYDAAAGLILPHLENRPLSLKRCPGGIEGEFFFQKDIGEKHPKWLRIERVMPEHRGAPIRQVIAGDRATLLYLANLGCIDENPWMSRAGSLDYPGFVLIDLDSQVASFDRIVEAALVVRRLLDRIGLAGYPKTTGGGGMHVYIPVEPRYTFEQTRGFAEIPAALAVRQNPELFTTPRSVAKRQKGKVCFDYLQNGCGKTVSCVYSPRARPGAPVATPLDSREVKRGLTPEEFNIRTVLPRFEKTGDLFRPVLEKRQAIERLKALVNKP